MPPRAAIVIPTRARPRYLDVALASIAPQAAQHGAEVVVVDDGPDEATRAVASRHRARYVAHDRPRGINVARNTALDAAGDADLVVYVDDDVEVWPGWLRALLAAADACPEEVGVFTGPVRARIEDHRFRSCGREGPPLTFLDLGPADTDAPRAWGANMALRRGAIERVGPFAEHLVNAGDEEEWQARWQALGGRVRYVAAAGLDHRRAGDDARLRALARAAFQRGRAARRYDELNGIAPPLRDELRVLAGCAAHGPRFRCFGGVTMTAHSLGRLRAALLETPAPATGEDFLSGASGTVGGRRGALLRAGDAWLDARELLSGRRLRLARAAAATPERRRVLVLGIERPGMIMDAARAELARSRHDVRVHTAPPAGRGKFENLNALLAAHPPGGFDWMIVIDDDIALPRGFLDRFLHVAETAGLRLAQPAHRLHSHAAWAITRRRPGVAARETTFVEIGPVTAFHRDTFATLLPFPELRMGWGLDAHWAAVAREHGWPIGIVDATPVGHTLAPVGRGYGRDAAVAEARAFLAGRPYVRRDEVRTLQVHR
ncbi:MAG TPA: glycosyltransferase [Solirubrobacteraceae bacterium]|nr:glycosyltransferase [Solirubrobacteraceae bacterium]